MGFRRYQKNQLDLADPKIASRTVPQWLFSVIHRIQASAMKLTTTTIVTVSQSHPDRHQTRVVLPESVFGGIVSSGLSSAKRTSDAYASRSARLLSSAAAMCFAVVSSFMLQSFFSCHRDVACHRHPQGFLSMQRVIANAGFPIRLYRDSPHSTKTDRIHPQTESCLHVAASPEHEAPNGVP